MAEAVEIEVARLTAPFQFAEQVGFLGHGHAALVRTLGDLNGCFGAGGEPGAIHALGMHDAEALTGAEQFFGMEVFRIHDALILFSGV